MRGGEQDRDTASSPYIWFGRQFREANEIKDACFQLQSRYVFPSFDSLPFSKMTLFQNTYISFSAVNTKFYFNNSRKIIVDNLRLAPQVDGLQRNSAKRQLTWFACVWHLTLPLQIKSFKNQE